MTTVRLVIGQADASVHGIVLPELLRVALRSWRHVAVGLLLHLRHGGQLPAVGGELLQTGCGVFGEFADVHLVGGEYLCRVTAVHAPALRLQHLPFPGAQIVRHPSAHLAKVHIFHLVGHQSARPAAAVPSVGRVYLLTSSLNKA